MGAEDTPQHPLRTDDVTGYERANRASIRYHVPRLMRDVYQEPGMEPCSIGDDSTWDHYPGQATAQFRLHSLGYLRTLTERYRESGELSYADKADTLMRRWLSVRGQPDDTNAWHGHEVALRTMTLSYLVAAGFSTGDDMTTALRTHADRLADPAHYQGAWNHGLDQNIALLQASAVLGDAALSEVAQRRLSEAAAQYVDAQGVVAEQATSYASYVHARLGRAIRELERCGAEVDPAVRRRDLIPTFLAWATRPDGLPVQIGDSMPEPSLNPDGSPHLEFVLSHGERGVPPTGRSIFYDDGWGFIRSGWGEHRPLREESHLTLRYGTFRRIHGHRDHTAITWYASGREVLADPGFSTYSDPEVRAYEQSETAHSAVTVPGAGKYRWERGTELLSHSSYPLGEHEDMHLALLAGFPYDGVERRRAVLHIPVRNVLVVWDQIAAGKEVVALQNWQFGASFGPHAQPDSGLLTDGVGQVRLVQHLPTGGPRIDAGGTRPMAGWVATGRDERVPAPCLSYEAAGDGVQFLTSLTLDDSAAVKYTVDGTLRIQSSDSGAVLVEVFLDPERGFVPRSLRPRLASRWDHRA